MCSLNMKCFSKVLLFIFWFNCQVADAVVIARYLGATLVLPDIRGSNPGDKRLALPRYLYMLSVLAPYHVDTDIDTGYLTMENEVFI